MATNDEASGLKRLSVKITPRTVEQLDSVATRYGLTTTESLRRMVELAALIFDSTADGAEVVIRRDGQEKTLTIL